MSIELLQFCPLSIKKNKVQYFSNKFAMMISKEDHGKFVNWAAIMYFQLVKKLIIWEKCQKNMIEGITKKKLKNDVCHSIIVLEVLFQKWFPLEGTKPQKKKK
jgi:hypothetical protein